MIIAKLLAIIVAMTFTLTSAAQESDSKRINKIKRDSKYLYAEGTRPTEEEARKDAEELLSVYIDEYVASKKKLSKAEHVVIKDLQSKIDRIQMKRGTMIRAFVYVKKSDIIPAENAIVTEVPKNKDLESAIEELPSVEISSEMPQWQQEVIKELMEKTSLTEARALLNRLKSEYKIKRHGMPATAKNTEKIYWLVETGDGSLTVLGPGNDMRTNYRTMQSDNLSNYSGKNAVWFEMAK